MTDDLKERLSRLADRATEPGGDALEHLHQRRARKDRTRRVGTIALALTVAVAGSWGAFAAFAGRDDRSAIGDENPSGVATREPPEILTVWPENPVRGASPDEVQAAVDAGDESLAWRLDPEQVADRFARTVLAWDPRFMLSVAKERGTARGVISPCGDAQYCAMLPADYQASLIQLVQPVRRGEGGIWSVASFTSHGLQIDLPLGDPATALTGGTEIQLNLDVEEARSVHIGLVARNGCSEIASLEPGLDSGRHTITLPEPEPAAKTDPSCGVIGAGFVFAYAQDDTTVPVGDPLLEPAAIEYPWLTIVPLYVEMIHDDGAAATQSPSPAAEPTVRPSTGPPLACPTAHTDAVEAVSREVTLLACDRWLAGTEIELHVVNHDVGVPILLELHPAAVCDEDGCMGATALWRADRSLEGPAEKTYRIPPLEAGDYVLVDAVHPVTGQIEILVRQG